MTLALTPEWKARLTKLWNSDATVADIEKELGLGKTALLKYRRAMGLPDRKAPRVTSAYAGGWSDDDIEIVKERWLKGESAGEIAKAFPNRSRNAIISVVHRNGWGRGRPAAPGVVRSRVRLPKPGPSSKPPGVFVLMSQATSAATEQQRQERAAEGRKAIARTDVVTVESPKALPFLEARSGCKWPIGEGLAMLSCCNPIHRGVYCEGHSAVAFSAVQPKERDRGDRAASSFTRYDRIAAPRVQAANDGLWDVAA